MVSFSSLQDVFLWFCRNWTTTTASPSQYLAKAFPLQIGWGKRIHFQWLPGTRSLNFSLDTLGYGACAAVIESCWSRPFDRWSLHRHACASDMPAGHMSVYMQMNRCQRGKSSRLCRWTGSFLIVSVTNLSANRSTLNSCNFVVSWRIELKFVALESWRVSFFLQRKFCCKTLRFEKLSAVPTKRNQFRGQGSRRIWPPNFFCSQKKRTEIPF